ncbi:DUF1858 domain-containing protein [Stappia indica]|uniref:DUF1858 domain-containing protein n=1 Tax=Stappia indica TaxID=538381 RepID=UPI0008332240|nr:DUF1858 domain-containing protein [Stappia indica]
MSSYQGSNAGAARKVGPETLVGELMSNYRATISVFIRHKMMCIGCPVARIHDVEEACREHGISLDAFLGELDAAIAGAA